MRSSIRMTAIPAILVTLLLFALYPAATLAGQLRAGAARVDITPSLGSRMAGTYQERHVTDVHDPLYAKALLLDDGATKLVLVICDNIGPYPEAYAKARAVIERELGIPPGNVLIHATHTHTGPAMELPYEDILAPGIADAVRMAATRLQPVTIRGGAGIVENLAFYRRILMKDGSVRFNPRYGPDLVCPAGNTDPEVGMFYIETLDAIPLAVFANFAMHVTTIGGRSTEVSADYPRWIAQVVQAVKGPQLTAFFASGAAGNTNHINWMQPRTSVADPYTRPERIGYMIGGEIIKQLPDLTIQEAPVLRAASEILGLKIPEYTDEQIAEARISAAKPSENLAATPEIREAMKMLRVHERKGEPLTAEVQVFGIGDIALVGLPGEIFVELGMAIKKQSPFPYTMIIQQSQYGIGYVPTREAFGQGAYEVEVSNIAPGEGERLVDTAVRLLKQIRM